MAKGASTQTLVALPTTFFLGGLDSYVQRYLKSLAVFFDPRHPALPLETTGTEAIVNEKLLEVAEALMLGDGVALNVIGENVVLIYLVRLFGCHETAELIRKGVIEFVGQCATAGSLVDPSAARQADGQPLPPGNPLAALFDWTKREAACYDANGLDGEAAATLALRRYADALHLDRRHIRELSRRAAKHTHCEPRDRVSSIQVRVGKAYSDGDLEPLGLSPKIARDTNTYQDGDVAALTNRVHRVENLLDFGLDQYQMPDEWVDIHRFTEDAMSGSRVPRAVDRIFELRHAPDLRSLFRDRILRVEDIPALRQHPATENFRRWLWERPDPRDADQLCEEFVRDVADVDKPTARKYMTRIATAASLTFAQDRALDALSLPPEQRVIADVSLGVAQLIVGAVVEKFRRRPPSGFFDQVIDEAIYNAAHGTRGGGSVPSGAHEE